MSLDGDLLFGSQVHLGVELMNGMDVIQKTTSANSKSGQEWCGIREVCVKAFSSLTPDCSVVGVMEGEVNSLVYVRGKLEFKDLAVSVSLSIMEVFLYVP